MQHALTEERRSAGQSSPSTSRFAGRDEAPALASHDLRPSVRTAGYFQHVWAVVRRVPPGCVTTYGQVAELAGFPGTARQVVWALRGAPRSAALPWHRVLGAGGQIRLPGASGIEQRLRLEAEGVAFAGSRVSLARHQWRP